MYYIISPKRVSPPPSPSHLSLSPE
jgi:hypothetical protein